MGTGKAKLLKRMLEFYGPTDFCRLGFRYAKNRFLSSLLRRVYCGTFYDLEHLFKYYNIEVNRCQNINSPLTIDYLARKNLDVIVSVAAPHIFMAALLAVPKWGCINIHSARLPKYRGMLPSFWNMYHNEKNSAITIHTMDLAIDKGKIMLQREFEIRPEESLDELIKRTKALGAMCLIEVLNKIKTGTVVYKETDGTPTSYFSFPTRDKVKEFRGMGKRLL